QPVSSVPVMRMLRNFSILNVFLPLPTRSCRKSTWPGLDRRVPMAANSMIGLVSMISTKLPTMSMLRLMMALVMRGVPVVYVCRRALLSHQLLCNLMHRIPSRFIQVENVANRLGLFRYDDV